MPHTPEHRLEELFKKHGVGEEPTPAPAAVAEKDNLDTLIEKHVTTPSVPEAPTDAAGAPDTLAERVALFEGENVREGSRFARGPVRDPGGAVLRAAALPARVSAGITSEVIGLERALAERVGLGRVVDPLDLAPDTALLQAARGELGENVGLGTLVEAAKRREAERNFGQNLLLEAGSDPLNIIPGVGFTGLGRNVARGGFKFAPQSLLTERPPGFRPFQSAVGGLPQEGSIVRQLAPSEIPPSLRPDVSRAARTAEAPSSIGDVAGRLSEEPGPLGDFFRDRPRRVANKAAFEDFVQNNIQPAFFQRFGDAPFFNTVRRGDEFLIEITSAGWEQRAVDLGLERVPGQGNLYRIPIQGGEIPPSLRPDARPAVSDEDLLFASMEQNRLGPQVAETPVAEQRARLDAIDRQADELAIRETSTRALVNAIGQPIGPQSTPSQVPFGPPAPKITSEPAGGSAIYDALGRKIAGRGPIIDLSRAPRSAHIDASGIHPGTPPFAPTGEVMAAPVEPSNNPLAWFAEFLKDPRRVDDWDLTTKWRREALAGRTAKFDERLRQLTSQGIDVDAAIEQASRETMGGELPRVLTGVQDVASPEIHRALFDRLYEVLQNESLEVLATSTALRNALLGKTIPRNPGTAGRSAFTRLVRVFGADITHGLNQKLDLPSVLALKGLSGTTRRPFTQFPRDPVLGVRQGELIPAIPSPDFPPIEKLSAHELARGRQQLNQINRDIQGARELERLQAAPEASPLEPGSPAEALRSEATTSQLPLFEVSPGNFANQTPDLRSELEKFTDIQTFKRFSRALETGGPFPTDPIRGPGINQTIPPEKTVRQGMFPERIPMPGMAGAVPPDGVVKHLELGMSPEKFNQWKSFIKEAGLNALDAGNLLRANMTSIDMSWWRQQAFLIWGNLPQFIRGNAEFFRSAWSQEYADNAWRAITNDPDFQFYNSMKGDFLRAPSSKQYQAWEKAEEFIVLGGDRPLQRLAARLPWLRISARAHVTAINAMNWSIYKGYLRNMHKIQESIASGMTVLKPGEAFSIEQEMQTFNNMLADLSGRGPLGRLKALSPELTNGFFAARLNIGRLISPRHLFSDNPRVRLQAWKNFTTAIAGWGGIVWGGHHLGWWEAELDPRSADFSKIRIGKVRVDPWGGFQQYAVLGVRLSVPVMKMVPGQDIFQRTLQSGPNEGETVIDNFLSTTTGKPSFRGPLDLGAAFVRGRVSPAVGNALEVWTGRDFKGSRIDRTDWKRWLGNNAPLSAQDIVEALAAEGLAGLAGLSGIVGAGVQAYESIQAQPVKGRVPIGGRRIQ